MRRGAARVRTGAENVLPMENELDLLPDTTRETAAGVMPPTQQLKRAIRKRLRLGIYVFLVTAPLFLLAVAANVKPLYQAKASVQVNEARPRILYATQENEPNHSYETFFQTQMALITNKAVLERCLEAPEVRESPLLADAADKVRKLQKVLNVERIEHTQLFSVWLEHPEGGGIADVVNAVLDAYVAYLDENDMTSQHRKILLLESERGRLREETQQLRERLALLREELASDPNAPPGGLVHDPISAAQESIVEAKAEQFTLQARLASLIASLEQEDIEVPEQEIDAAVELDPEVERLLTVSMGIRETLIAAQIEATKPPSVMSEQRMEAAPEVIALREEIAEQELEVARLSRTLKPRHPLLQVARESLDGSYARLEALRESFENESGQEEARREAEGRVADLQSQLDLVQDQIERRRVQIRPIISERLREQARSEIRHQIRDMKWEAEAAEIRVRVLVENLKTQLHQRTQYERRSAEYVSLEESLRRAQESLSAVEQRLHELEVESAAPGYVSIAMKAAAPAGPEPHVGRLARYGMMAVVAAAGFSVLVMVGVERRDDRIWSEDDIKGCLSVPLLGSVPDAGPRYGGEEAALACYCDSETYLAEKIRNVAAGILHSPDHRPVRSILVTSAGPAEGKTTLAANMASCIANAGKRALLIDANFRKPDIAGVFELGNVPGLGDVLTGDEVLMLPDDSALSILPAGTPPPHADLIASPAMKELLESVTADYDCVVIDGPPMTLAEARLLAPMVDGVVLTAKAFASRRASVMSSIEVLGRLGAHTLGLVLIGCAPEDARTGEMTQTLQAYSRWPRLAQMRQFVPVEEEVVVSAPGGGGGAPAGTFAGSESGIPPEGDGTSMKGG